MHRGTHPKGAETGFRVCTLVAAGVLGCEGIQLLGVGEVVANVAALFMIPQNNVGCCQTCCCLSRNLGACRMNNVKLLILMMGG